MRNPTKPGAHASRRDSALRLPVFRAGNGRPTSPRWLRRNYAGPHFPELAGGPRNPRVATRTRPMRDRSETDRVGWPGRNVDSRLAVPQALLRTNAGSGHRARTSGELTKGSDRQTLRASSPEVVVPGPSSHPSRPPGKARGTTRRGRPVRQPSGQAVSRVPASFGPLSTPAAVPASPALPCPGVSSRGFPHNRAHAPPPHTGALGVRTVGETAAPAHLC